MKNEFKYLMTQLRVSFILTGLLLFLPGNPSLYAQELGLLAISTTPLPTNNFASNWQSAIEAYQTKDYNRAQELFENMIEAQSPHAPHADLTFNLGNVYYQQGESGQAAWMYEKTLALAPRHPDARHNLALVRSSLSVPTSEPFFLFKPIAWAYSRLTASEWTALLLAATLATALSASLWILLRANTLARRLSKALTLTSLSLTLLITACLIPRYHETENKHYGIVIAHGSIVRSAPGPEEDKYFEALESERLEVTEANVRGWLKVKRPSDGRVGYLPENTLRPI